jgi:uncharacterized membrane-anchored protein
MRDLRSTAAAALRGLTQAVVILLATAAPAVAQSSEQNARAEALGLIAPTPGPAQVQLPGGARLTVPAGFAFLEPYETTWAAGSLLGTKVEGEYALYSQTGTWNVFIRYDESGYVRDTGRIDADALLRLIRAHEQAQAHSGAPQQRTVGWAQPLRYDRTTRRLDCSTLVEVPAGLKWTHETRVLGRQGYFTFTLASDASFDEAYSVFEKALAGFVITPGHRYEDFRSGDKLAPGGISALVGLPSTD